MSSARVSTNAKADGERSREEEDLLQRSKRKVRSTNEGEGDPS